MNAPEKTLVSCLAADVLHLILVPSEGCRPGTARRYEAPRAHEMQSHVVRGVRNLLTDRTAELRALSLSWAGGEPLLAPDVVFGLLSHACHLRRRNPRLVFSSDMSTGGDLLDRHLFERLVDLGVSEFRVTFDGDDLRDHADTRCQGGPTARVERVWSNLAELLTVRRPFTVQLRLPVDDPDQLDPYVERYHRVFRGDSRFDLTLCTPPEVLAEEIPATSFVVRPDGRVDRCSPLASDESRAIGRIHESGLLELDGDRF